VYNGVSAKRWYVVSLGAVIKLFVFAMATTCMPVLFSEIAAELHLSIVQIGAVWGFGSVAGIFSILTAGFLADRFGAKRILTIACLLGGAFPVSTGRFPLCRGNGTKEEAQLRYRVISLWRNCAFNGRYIS
jgi:MFS family permease